MESFNKYETNNPFLFTLNHVVDELKKEYKFNPLHEQVINKFRNDVLNTSADPAKMTEESIKGQLLQKLEAVKISKKVETIDYAEAKPNESELSPDEITGMQKDLEESLANNTENLAASKQELTLETTEKLEEMYSIKEKVRAVGIVGEAEAEKAYQKYLELIVENADLKQNSLIKGAPDKELIDKKFDEWFKSQFPQAA